MGEGRADLNSSPSLTPFTFNSLPIIHILLCFLLTFFCIKKDKPIIREEGRGKEVRKEDEQIESFLFVLVHSSLTFLLLPLCSFFF